MATRKKARKRKVGSTCKKSTYKSPAAAKGAASMARKILPKSKKVTVEGKSVVVCG